MNKLPVKPKLLALALLPLLLVACGGGGDDKDNGNSNNPADPKNPGSNVTPNGKRTPLPNTAVAPPNDEEKAAFEKSKVSVVRSNLADKDKPAPFIIKINENPTRGFNGEYEQRDFSRMPAGFSEHHGQLELVKKEEDNNNANNGNNANNKNNKKEDEEKDKEKNAVTLRSYQGLRSGVVLSFYDKGGIIGADTYGVDTEAAKMPTSGKATYSGVAFDRNERGTLEYNVNFTSKRGDGRIQGIKRYGMITLDDAEFTSDADGVSITGRARNLYSQPLQYRAEFYGNNAEELSGKVTNTANQDAVVFHGTRGEIVQ